MNINQSKVDDLNAVLTVTIDKDDYYPGVEKLLKDYQKNANVPGFRKGNVPMGMIKKQYEDSLVYEEVNKLLQSSVNDHIQKEEVSILGAPIPRMNENLDWKADSLEFTFDLGISPEFDLDLKNVTVRNFNVVVNEEDVDKYVTNFRKRFGETVEADSIEEGASIKGTFYNVDKKGEMDESSEEAKATIRLEQIADKEKFNGLKKDDTVKVNSKDLFNDQEELKTVFGLDDDEVLNFDKDLVFKISEIKNIEPAPIDQKLFDNVYGEGNEVDSEEAFRKRIKEEAEKMYVGETDRQLLNDTVEAILGQTEFPMPDEFLKKWIVFSSEGQKSMDEAENIYEEAKKGLRFQLIENKIATAFDIQVSQDDLMDKAREAIKEQMQMYGAALKIEDDQLEDIAKNVLQNQEEAKKIADQLFAEKLVAVFKEEVNLEKKEVSFEEFVEIVQGESKLRNSEEE